MGRHDKAKMEVVYRKFYTNVAVSHKRCNTERFGYYGQ